MGRLIAERPASDWAEAQFEINPNNDPDQLPIAVFRVLALPSSQCPAYDWWQANENSGGCVRRLRPDELDWKVSSKAKKLPAYRQAVQLVALLIYANRMQESGMVELPDNARLSTSHGFDEVHLLIHPLKTMRLA